MEPDDKDIKILLSLIENARTPITKIAEDAKLSVSATKYRINKLERTGIIRNYKLVLNMRGMPFDEYDVYYTFTQTAPQILEQAILQFIKCPFSTQVLTTMGYCDLRITVLARNAVHLQELLDEAEVPISAHVKSRTILGITTKYKSSAQSFLTALFQRKISMTGAKLRAVHKKMSGRIDAIDKTLIKELANDPKKNYTDLAKQVRLTAEAVAYRVKRLEEQNIIFGYTTLLNGQQMGYQWAVLLLNLRYRTHKERAQLITYMQTHAFVSSAVETIGSFTLSITLFGQTLQSIHDTELDFRNRFGEHIMDAQLMLILKNEKYPDIATGVIDAV